MSSKTAAESPFSVPGIAIPGGIGAALGGLSGAIAPGETEEGEQKSRLAEALKRSLLGGGLGAALGGYYQLLQFNDNPSHAPTRSPHLPPPSPQNWLVNQGTGSTSKTADGIGSAHPYPAPNFAGAVHSTPASGARRFLGDVKKQKAGLGGEDEAFTAKRGMAMGQYHYESKTAPGFQMTSKHAPVQQRGLSSSAASPGAKTTGETKAPKLDEALPGKAAQLVLLYELNKQAGLLYKDIDPRGVGTQDLDENDEPGPLHVFTERTQAPRALTRLFSNPGKDMRQASGDTESLFEQGRMLAAGHAADPDTWKKPPIDYDDPSEWHRVLASYLQERWPSRYRALSPETATQIMTENALEEEEPEEAPAKAATYFGAKMAGGMAYALPSTFHSNNANPAGSLADGPASQNRTGASGSTRPYAMQSEKPAAGPATTPPPKPHAASMVGKGVARGTIE